MLHMPHDEPGRIGAAGPDLNLPMNPTEYFTDAGLRALSPSALMLGAGRVIAIDEVTERLAMAEAAARKRSISRRRTSTTSS